jgi:hypothetical protein
MESDPKIPKACQILVLDSPKGKWKVDHQFAPNNLRLAYLKPFTFTTDAQGKAIQPESILLAAPDVGINGTVKIFSRNDNTSKWEAMELGRAVRYSTTRAIGFHHDKITGVDYVFAGNDTLGTLRGVYDPHITGRIRWNKTPEFTFPPDERVMNFCVCNGVCFCATTKKIFRRTDGHTATWEQIYSCPQEIKPVGIRGLTSVPNPTGGESLLFAALSKVRCLDVNQGYKETIELDMPAMLSEQRGIKVSFVLAAYNEFLPVKIPGSEEAVWLFGFESCYPQKAAQSAPQRQFFVKETPPRYYDAGAFYFIRRITKDGAKYTVKYTTAEVTDPRKPVLVAVRAVAPSPFAEDRQPVFYFGGFDCNFIPSHNTAWIYRAELGGNTP